MADSAGPTSVSAVAGELARRWATQRLNAVQAYGRILSDYGTGRSTSSAAAGAMAKLAAEEAVRYPADALGLAVDFAGALARKAGLDLRSAPVAGAARPIQDLEISGPLGGSAIGEVLLTNPHAQAVAVTFDVSGFTGPAGESAPAPAVTPAAFTLQPGQDRQVSVRADLDPKVFTPGCAYAALLTVAGFDDMVVRIRLTVLPG